MMRLSVLKAERVFNGDGNRENCGILGDILRIWAISCKFEAWILL